LKVLLDTCLSPGAKNELLAAGHDVVWSGDWPEDPGDAAILDTAFRQQRVLITLDKDFGELASRRRVPHCGIVRLVNLRAKDQGAACLRVLAGYERELAEGALITVEPGRIRIRQGSS
jgi:predicted nuclease of predicted toxin-antitoxin system